MEIAAWYENHGMTDPRFFSPAGPFTLAELAEIAGAVLVDDADADRRFADIAPLEAAGRDEVSFLDNRRYIDAFATSKAGACVVAPALADRAAPGMALLLADAPYRAYARIARAFHPTPPLEPGVSAAAAVDESATLAPGCRVEAGAVIAARAEIGERCHIGANAVIGAGVVLGEDCVIGACASVSHALIGARVNIYPGARIGQEGFGFAPGAEGHLRIPHTGRVIIGDDVEIGANATVDRGSGPDTVIGAGSMIDNLVQIAHNVQLGKGCILAAMVGVSGSTKLGDFVVCAGQVGLAGHLKVGDGATLIAHSGLMHDLPPGSTYGPSPALPAPPW